MTNNDPIWDNSANKLIEGILKIEPTLSTNQEVFDYIVNNCNNKKLLTEALGEPGLADLPNTLTSIITTALQKLRDEKRKNLRKRANDDPLWDDLANRLISGFLKIKPSLSTNQEIFDFIADNCNDQEIMTEVLEAAGLSMSGNILMNTITTALSNLRDKM